MRTLISGRRKAVALLVAGMLLGALVTSAPVTGAADQLAPQVVAQLKKSFYTKAQTNSRFYTKKQANRRFYTKKLANTRFFTKGQADARFLRVGATYVRADIDAKLAGIYTKGDVDSKLAGVYSKTELDEKLAALDNAITGMLVIRTANGVGNNLGCPGGRLAVEIKNAKGQERDARFTFQVAGATPAFGQIRSNGSVRSSSGNVTGVTHSAGSGVYCITFAVAPAASALEGAVVSLHTN